MQQLHRASKMSRSLAVVWSLVCCFRAASLLHAEDSLLRLEELRAGYMQNFMSIEPYRVIVNHKTLQTQEHLDVLNARLSRLQPISYKLKGDSRLRVESQIARLTQMIQGFSIGGYESRAAFIVGKDSAYIVVPRATGGTIPTIDIRGPEDLANHYTRYASKMTAWAMRALIV